MDKYIEQFDRVSIARHLDAAADSIKIAVACNLTPDEVIDINNIASLVEKAEALNIEVPVEVQELLK